ncbi:hypothetical protein Tco_0721165, partial [Tanacetum coccineum]
MNAPSSVSGDNETRPETWDEGCRGGLYVIEHD